MSTHLFSVIHIDFYKISFEFGFEMSVLKMDGARYLKSLTRLDDHNLHFNLR
jgi:hypothetical protein